MVAGLKFLSKKGFNPQNMTNQKRVWEAKSQQKQEDKKFRDRNEQLKRERDDEELTKARGEDVKLNWAYVPPPGMEGMDIKPEADDDCDITIVADTVKSTSKRGNGDDGDGKPKASDPSQGLDITKVQPGDDPAAAAFRRMLAAATAGDIEEDDDEAQQQHQQSTGDKVVFGAVMQGTSIEKERKGKDSLSALEKAVGRRDGNQSQTLDEQVSRFPQLKNAPMAKGMNGTDVGVSFKPLGSQLRNVRCLSCGVWGHSRGERECEKSGWNPFAAKGPLTSIPQQEPPRVLETQQKVAKPEKDDRSINSNSSSSSSSKDSHRERKRRKKSKRRHRKKESKKSRKRSSRSESPDRRRRRRDRSASPGDDQERSQKSSKKSRRKEKEPSRS